MKFSENTQQNCNRTQSGMDKTGENLKRLNNATIS